MLLALMTTAALTACPTEQAVYALRTEPTVTARFLPAQPHPDWPADVMLRIDGHGHRYWFLPSPGGSSGESYMISTLDPTQAGWAPPSPDGGPRPLGDLQYMGFDKTYLLEPGLPRAGQPAPAHILLPTLDDALRHPKSDQPRDSLPRQFFDLTGCQAS